MVSLAPPFVAYPLIANLTWWSYSVQLGTCSSKVPLPAVKDKGNLQAQALCGK